MSIHWCGYTGINDQYWLGIGGCDREERINFLYDHHSFNVMDDVITRDAENVDYQGDIMSAVIFACLFKVCVVIYQTTKPLMTYLLDGRKYDTEKGFGLTRFNVDGIHPKLVPNGGDILTIVQYKTDDVDHGVGNGPEHWVCVKTPEQGSSYEPQDKLLFFISKT